jgi:chloride channel protein, CIC family
MREEPALRIAGGTRRPLILGLLSIVVGAFTGLIGASFRLLLHSAEVWRTSAVVHAHSWSWFGFVSLVCVIASTGGAAACLVFRYAPQAAGSGIPHVEHELKVGWSGNTVSIVIVKFFGGILAMGGGFALGREGPTIQIGGGIGHLIGRAFDLNSDECRVLLAAGAGAGLATAFNAPIAGAVFVLEELFGTFDAPITIATLGASASAICVSRVFLGQSPDFHVPTFGFLNFGVLPVSILLGIFTGLLGVLYNRAILTTLKLSSRFTKFDGGLRAGSIGVLIGVIAWFAPAWVGAGDSLTQQALSGPLTLTVLASVFALRFFLGPLSYAARTPGGLFAPMLVIGSQAGLLFFALCSHLVPSLVATPPQFAIVGMASLFASVVRAPVTGIILAVELTGSFTLLLPMLGAAFAAAVTASLLGEPPIYDSLRCVR